MDETKSACRQPAPRSWLEGATIVASVATVLVIVALGASMLALASAIPVCGRWLLDDRILQDLGRFVFLSVCVAILLPVGLLILYLLKRQGWSALATGMAVSVLALVAEMRAIRNLACSVEASRKEYSIPLPEGLDDGYVLQVMEEAQLAVAVEYGGSSGSRRLLIFPSPKNLVRQASRILAELKRSQEPN